MCVGVKACVQRQSSVQAVPAPGALSILGRDLRLACAVLPFSGGTILPALKEMGA